ncbi:MAG: hypothetical protein ACOYMF_05615 [Bacteroidales bacterium]
MKANYSTRPEALINQNNGSWLYNYDIVSVTKTDAITGEQSIEWECGQVIIWGEVTKKKVKSAIIVSEITPEDEKKLINDYNAYEESVLTDAKYKSDYLAFLQRRKVIKELVDADELIDAIE